MRRLPKMMYVFLNFKYFKKFQEIDQHSSSIFGKTPVRMVSNI